MNHKIFTRIPKHTVAVVVTLLAFAITSIAADVVETARDNFGETSWNSGLHWSDGNAPSAGNHYFTSNWWLRTPTSTNDATFDNGLYTFTFVGSSANAALTINPGSSNNNPNYPYSTAGAVYMKINDGAVNFPLPGVTNLGRLVNAFAPNSIVTWRGYMDVPLLMVTNTTGNNTNDFDTNGFMIIAGGAFDLQNGNQGSTTDTRYVTNAMVLSGDGYLTNMPSTYLPAVPMPPGYITYIGNSTNFFGSIVIQSNVLLSALNETNLFGDPTGAYRSNSLFLDGGVFRLFYPTNLDANTNPYTISSNFVFDYTNAGMWVSTRGGQIDIPPGFIFTNSLSLGGPGTLTLTNTGTMVIDGGNATNFTGALVVNIGTLILTTNNALAGPFTLTIGPGGTFDASAEGLDLGQGGTLAGDGTISGPVVCGTNSSISPGGSGNAATLTVGGLTLTDGAILPYDFSLTTNDVINVNGNLSASGLTTIKLNSLPPTSGTYTLMTVSGTFSPGSLANFTTNLLVTRGTTVHLNYATGTPNRLEAVITVAPAGNDVWTNSVNNTWDIASTANWVTNGVSTVYYDLDNVNFTDVGATNPTNQNYVSLNTIVNPKTVTFNSSSNYYLSGSGGIAGPVALIQKGTGRTLVATTNSYSGGTTVTNGVLALGAPAALGNPSTTLAVVSGNGTLDVHGQPLDTTTPTVPVQVSGSGYNGQGVVNNTIGGLTSGSGDIGVGTLELTGNSTVAASSSWQVGNGTQGGIDGNGYTLTKISTNVLASPTNYLYTYLYLRNTALSPVSSFVIADGGVLFWDHADAVGATTPIILTNGGFIDTWDPADNFNGLTFYNPITVNDASKGGAIMNFRTVNYGHSPYDTFNGDIYLQAGLLTISNVSSAAGPSYGIDTFNGTISGPGGLNIVGSGTTVSPTTYAYGVNQVVLNGANTYTGPTYVTNSAYVMTTTASQGGGAWNLGDVATLDVAVSPVSPTMPMKSLALSFASLGPLYYGANISFARLPEMPTVPVIYATNLYTLNAGFAIDYIFPPSAGYSIGQFPLIKYNGSIQGDGFVDFALATLPGGVSATLVNNTTNNTIDLKVTAAGKEWTGAVNSNWDASTLNWTNPATSSKVGFSDNDTVTFGDNATSYNVYITRSNLVSGIMVNATNNYYWGYASNGFLAGSGVLTKRGSGTLDLECTNLLTGGTYIYGGTIKLDNRGALNRDLGAVYIDNGSTLDVNNNKVPNSSGYGPDGCNVYIGGNSALINSNPSNPTNGDTTLGQDVADAGPVTLFGNAYVGGAGDLNIRGGRQAHLNSLSGTNVLTKVGAGKFRLRDDATVSTNFGLINILGGIVSYESTSTLGLGDPTKSILIGSGCGFAWGSTNVPCVRPLICSNNSTLYGYNQSTNVINSLVTNVGNITLSGVFYTNGVASDAYHGLIFNGVISGSGGVTVDQRSLMTFAAANNYSGNTYVSGTATNNGVTGGSVLSLVGNGSMNSSPNIVLYGTDTNSTFAASLVVTNRTDGTLTLVSGQTLRGYSGSSVIGSVVANIGSTIALGGGTTNIQYMTISSNLTLSSGSTVAMDVSVSTNGVTNDVINVTGTNNYAGTLQLTALTTLAAGDSFQLFNNGQYTGTFATISGSPGAGLAWSFDPSSGIASVVSSSPTNRITWYIANGTNLVMGWSAAGTNWTLQAQTNTLAKGLWTNWSDVAGSRAVTQQVMTITRTNPAVFYRLKKQ